MQAQASYLAETWSNVDAESCSDVQCPEQRSYKEVYQASYRSRSKRYREDPDVQPGDSRHHEWCYVFDWYLRSCATPVMYNVDASWSPNEKLQVVGFS
jgi:hypothetical protein